MVRSSLGRTRIPLLRRKLATHVAQRRLLRRQPRRPKPVPTLLVALRAGAGLHPVAAAPLLHWPLCPAHAARCTTCPARSIRGRFRALVGLVHCFHRGQSATCLFRHRRPPMGIRRRLHPRDRSSQTARSASQRTCCTRMGRDRAADQLRHRLTGQFDLPRIRRPLAGRRRRSHHPQ